MEYIGYCKYCLYNIGYSEYNYEINKIYIGNNQIIIFDDLLEENLYGYYDKINDIYIIDKYNDNGTIKNSLTTTKCKILQFIKFNDKE